MMKGKKLINNVIKYIFLLVFLFILSVYFIHSSDASFQNDSEGLALGRIIVEKFNLQIDTNVYGLGKLSSLSNPEDDEYAMIYYDAKKLSLEGYEYRAYKSQIGLQGMAYVLVTKIFSVFDVYHLYLYLRLACCFFLALILLGIVWQLYKRYGILFSLVFFAVSFMSPSIVNFSRNLYWVEFIWFIPMFLGLLCLNYENKRVFIYPLFFIAIFAKCLCGYEYVSTIMMTGIMFLTAEWFSIKEKRKELFKVIFIIGIMSVLGFAAAYVLHAYWYGDGDIISGLKLLKVNLIERRTFGNASDFAPVYADSLNASVFAVLKKYLWEGDYYAGKVILLLLVITSVCLIYQNRILHKKNIFEISLFLVALATSLSWFVLAKAHSYIHTHMNFAMWCMGFVQVCFYLIIKIILETKKIKLSLTSLEE